MKLRHSAMAAALVAIWAGLCPQAALAEERGCPGMRVESDAGFRSRWPDLLERIQSELSARADVDACARVDLRLERDSVIWVSVTLPDGRAASRGVMERDDVVPTLQALLLVPDRSAPAPAAALLPPTAPAPARTVIIDEPSRTVRDEPPATAGARSLGIELSFVTGARMGDGQLGIGAGVLSFVELNGWLVGFEGRADAYRAMGGGDPGAALELAILAGRRLYLGSVALDLSAGPAVAVKGFDSSEGVLQRVSAMTTDMPPSVSDMPPPIQLSDRRSGPVPRLLLGARLGFSPRSIFRTFVGIDGEVGPAQASPDPSSARLPAYTVGFSLGATLGTP